MPAILENELEEPAAPVAPKKPRRFLGNLRKATSFYTGGDIPPEAPAPAGIVNAPAGLGEPVDLARELAAARAKIAELEKKKNPVETVAAGGGEPGKAVAKAVANAVAPTGEIQLDIDSVPEMPKRPGGATSEPLPEDRPAAKSGKTPMQARLQAEMDATAEMITGNERQSLMAQRSAMAQRSEGILNAPGQDLLKSPATPPPAAGQVPKGRLRAMIEPGPGPARTVGEVFSEAHPGWTRAGRATSRILGAATGTSAGRAVGKLFRGIPILGETMGAVQDITRGEGSNNEGWYRPSPEEYDYAKQGADSAIGAPLFNMTETEIPFMPDNVPYIGGKRPGTIKIPGGVVPDAAYKMLLGSPGQMLAVGRDVIKTGVHGARAASEAMAARKERVGSEAKYGTVEKATATRHAMDQQRAKENEAKAKDKAESDRLSALKDYMDRMQQMYPEEQ